MIYRERWLCVGVSEDYKRSVAVRIIERDRPLHRAAPQNSLIRGNSEQRGPMPDRQSLRPIKAQFCSGMTFSCSEKSLYLSSGSCPPSCVLRHASFRPCARISPQEVESSGCGSETTPSRGSSISETVPCRGAGA